MTANQSSQSSDAGKDNSIEEIGRVKLDLSVYPGEDLYCDGAVEDTLLKIARDRSPVEYKEAIEEQASWPVLYHLSELRENIVEWLPIDKSMKVLEVGSGCGAITGALAAKAGSVTCCDLSHKRSRINAYRHMYDDNITIHVGNFTDIEKNLDTDYDYICLIGVFEYAASYVDSADPFGDFLKMIGAHVKPGGSIAIAIENRFGLKYWAGCKEDHLSEYFKSLENYPEGGPARTFTANKLIEIAERCGYKDHHMYYPYPDYKFMTDLFSDRRLPHRGELKNNIRNFDNDRLLLFNEKDVFDSILDEGLFPLYSNSYMMILGPRPDTEYVRYSNDRMRRYCIATEIADVHGIKVVRKRALNPDAAEHLREMKAAYEELAARYTGKGSMIEVNRATLSEDGMTLDFEYVDGVSLEDLLDEKLENGDIDGFIELFKDYIKRVGYGEKGARITDIDLIFSNILVSGDKWTIIDYEWTTSDVLTARELAFRAIYCYILEDPKREKLSLDIIIQLLNIDEETAVYLREREMQFQKSVTGNHKSLGEIREMIGRRLITVADLSGRLNPGASADEQSHVMRPQVYEDTGLGFNEEESFFASGYPFTMEIPKGRRALRIDPCSDFCIVAIREISWNGTPLPLGGMRFKTNGRKIGRDTYAFATSDPQFTISLKGTHDNSVNLLTVDMNVTRLDPETAGKLG